MAHRLELAYKDVKKNAAYDKVICLLMGIYYFYHNSPKQRDLKVYSAVLVMLINDTEK